MILNSIEKILVFSIHKCDFILNLFIYTILVFTLFNLVNNGLDNAFGGSVKEPPMVYDQNLQITQLTEDLNFPTGIDFLAEDDILVIEKSTGQVKRIVDGEILNEPVLDLNVASESERGLLGIAILNTKGLTNSDTTTTNEKSQEENNLNNEEVKVFLFYTETRDIDNGDILGNRLYKYDFTDGKLVNPKLLLDLPFLPGPSHNGGVLELGPDNNLYLVVGDINREGNPEYMTLAQNIEDSELPDGRGGVLRLTIDGDPVVDDDDSLSALGRNFGIITDIEINPYDGKIYVVDGKPKNGKIYQIYPKELN